MHRWCPVMLNALSKSFTCSLILILILILHELIMQHTARPGFLKVHGRQLR